MEVNSNIEDLIKKLQDAANRAEALDFSAPLIAGLNAGMAQMKHRVFNTGHDSKGVSFGKYVGKKSRATNRKFRVGKDDTDETSKQKTKLKKRLKKNVTPGEEYTEHEKKRLSRGRQVNYKDLELEGDLRKDIRVAKINETKAAIVLPNDKLYKIAEGLSKQTSKLVGVELKIFSLSEKERALMSETSNELLKQLYAGLFSA